MLWCSSRRQRGVLSRLETRVTESYTSPDDVRSRVPAPFHLQQTSSSMLILDRAWPSGLTSTTDSIFFAFCFALCNL
jgi:hypothetical protein